MSQPVPPTTRDRDDVSLPELDEARLEEVEGGALNAYLELVGETQGSVEGHWDQDSF